MKAKEKRMILILIIITILIIGILSIVKNSKNNEQTQTEQKQEEVKEKYVDVLPNGIKLNKSNKLNEVKKLDGLEISNIQLTHRSSGSVLLADVKNTTSVNMDLTKVEITLLDEKGNVLKKLNTLISPVKAGETVQLNCSVSSDYTNAYDFTIVKK